MTDPSLFGVPVRLSPYVPKDQILRVGGEVVIFGRDSRRSKWRRPHGRGCNVRRRKRVSVVRYSPMWDRLKAVALSETEA
jgi:hypothetical protein